MMLMIDDGRNKPVRQILCGSVLTMTGERVDGPQVIEIEGDRIRAVRPRQDTDKTAEGTLDLSQLTVVPGLIDAHTHLDFDVLAGNEPAQAAVNDATLLLRMVDRAVANLRRGVTAVRLVGSRNFLDIALRKAIADGDLPGPRIVTATRGLTSSHSPSPNNPTADGEETIRRLIRENIRNGADLIKIFHSGSVGGGEDSCAPLYSYAELCAAVDESHRYGRTITAHAYGGLSVDECIEAGIDCIEHGFFMTAEQYDRAAAKGIWVVPTLGVMTTEPGIPELPHWDDEIRRRLLGAREASWKSVGLLRASGARFALATDAIHGGVAKEAIYGAKGGLTNMEALASVTSSAAEVSGLKGKAGVIAPGAWADLLAIEGDPREDLVALENVRTVLKGGRIVVGT